MWVNSTYVGLCLNDYNHTAYIKIYYALDSTISREWILD